MEEIEIVQIKSSGCGVYTYDSNEQDINVNDYCIIENPYDSDDVDVGQVTWKQKIQKQASSKSILKIMRKATEDDIKRFEENTNKEKEAHVTCRKKIKDRQLPMKLVKSHYSFDCSKITFYFTSDKRVDFRELVKDLAYIFKRRIELRQIGPRDEARMLGGVGCCGKPLCCTTFLLKKLGKVHMKMAKEQNMTLTPSKISGICGKLLCCLEFESDWYQHIRKAMPQIGSMYEAEGISGKVEETDPFHGIVKIRDNNGKLIEIKIDDA